jgi:hypothetical protein
MEAWVGTLQDWYEEPSKIELLGGKLAGMAQSLAVVGAMIHPRIPWAQKLGILLILER